MVIPSDHWCTSIYFTKVMDNQGKKVTINDYETAFREDAELYSVRAKIGEIMSANGYPVKDYMQEYKSLMDEQTEEEVTMSSSGSALVETPLDMLRLRVKYDIELRVILLKQNISRLPQMAQFIIKNLPFVSQVSFMGLEIIGNAEKSYDKINVEPNEDYHLLNKAIKAL